MLRAWHIPRDGAASGGDSPVLQVGPRPACPFSAGAPARMSHTRLDSLESEHRNGPCVWALGGGKGGVGKSVITANLAIALARRGQRCVVVDADLGGGNLHTIFGVRKPHRTLSDFLSREVSELSEVLCDTTIPNLSLVSGARAFLAMANPKHSQKER